MKATEFCYWLQGAFELNGNLSLNEAQVTVIKQHLHMVFLHDIDPSYPANQQTALNAAHTGNSTTQYGNTTSDNSVNRC